MILNILGQILGLVAITFFGLLVVNLFMSKVHIFERVSLGFLVGLGIFTFVLFLANWFLAVPFEIFPVVAILFWLIILFGFINLLFRRKLSYKFNFIEWYRSLSGIEKGIALLIGFILFSVFVSDLYWPIWMWDAIALYDYRAKNMVLLGRIVGSFSVSSGTYPLLTSMSHGIIYLFGGTNPQYLYFLFLLSLSVIFYFFLRRFLVRKYSLISLLFLISIPLLTQQAQVALTDLPQSAYLVPAFLYLILGLSEENKSYIIFSGIFFTLSTWVRNEPFWMVGLFVLFIFSYKQKWFLLDGLYYIIVHIVSNIWNNFIVGHLPEVLKVETAKVNFFSDYSTTLFRSNYWITVISFIFNNVLFFILPLYIVMLMLLFLKRDRLSKAVILMTVLICGIVLLFSAGTAFYILTVDYWQALYSSLRRIVIFLDVLVVANISLLLFSSQKNIKKTENGHGT